MRVLLTYSRNILRTDTQLMLQIVFLPGFLGSAHEFLTFADKIPVGAQILSLPGSGCSDAEVDFSSINDWMEEQLIGLKVKECVLYGYSMGGRIAAHYAITAERPKIAVKGLILESAGFGIADKQTRKERYRADCAWADKFATEPMKDVVTEWYNQPVFADLTDEEKERLIVMRSRNIGVRMAKTMTGLSTGKMPYLGEAIRKTSLPLLYLYGENDAKYGELAAGLQKAGNPAMSIVGIPECGHNIHMKKPEAVITEINKYLNKNFRIQ